MDNFSDITPDELISIREKAREEKDWKLCDEIRDYLDTKSIFINDTPDGQEVYFEVKGTREDLVNKININRIAESRFDAWLYSTLKK